MCGIVGLGSLENKSYQSTDRSILEFDSRHGIIRTIMENVQEQVKQIEWWVTDNLVARIMLEIYQRSNLENEWIVLILEADPNRWQLKKYPIPRIRYQSNEQVKWWTKSNNRWTLKIEWSIKNRFELIR